MEGYKENLPLTAALANYHPNTDGLDPSSIDPEIWLLAEQRIQEILYVVQPNIVSDKRRKETVNYVRQLINNYFGTEVLAFGSVPLKTYLPDGDVDLTAFCYQNLTETFAGEVCNALKSEEGPEFRIKDIQYIEAQVKVVKCTVMGGTAVDISFKQISGLCTLHFLEQADQFVGRDHLFKRSIILIKAWCYYESRVLGAHNGLLSTYALEIMVLYVIGLYGESLRGPLEVLYRFLEYYSTFDWKKYCLTINGPVELSSLAECNTNSTADGASTFLSKEFLQNCRDIFANAIKAHEGEVQEFFVKHLNILDPLKENNNLGRSVGLGSYYRIVQAFAYGLELLQKILTLPGVMLGEGLEKYFESTLERNGRGERPDLLVPIPAFGTGKFERSDLTGDSDSYYGGLQYSQIYNNYTYVWDENTLTWTMQPIQNRLGGMVPVINGLGGTFYHQNPPLPPAPGYSLFRSSSSRGTGTYIPELTYSMYKDDPYWTRKKRNPDSNQQGLWLKSDQTSDGAGAVENPGRNDGKEESGPFDLSLESFPLLQGTTKSPPEISKICHNSSAWSFGHSSQVASKEAKNASSSFLSTPEFVIAGSRKQQELADMNAPKKQELEKIREEADIQRSYELEDKEDFPPLSF